MKDPNATLAAALRAAALSDPWATPGDLLWHVCSEEYTNAVRTDRGTHGFGVAGPATRRLLSLACRALNGVRFYEWHPRLPDRLRERVAKLSAEQLPVDLASELVVLDYEPKNSTALVSSRGLLWLSYREARARRRLVPVGSGSQRIPTLALHSEA